MKPEFRSEMAALVARHAGSMDAVVLACTELPLALSQAECAMPVINPTEEQCRAAFAFAAGLPAI